MTEAQLFNGPNPSAVLPMPVYVDQHTGEVITGALDVSSLYPRPVQEAWQAEPGSVFSVVQQDGESLGFVTTVEVRKRTRVYFTQWNEAHAFLEWLLRKMSSPTLRGCALKDEPKGTRGPTRKTAARAYQGAMIETCNPLPRNI